MTSRRRILVLFLVLCFGSAVSVPLIAQIASHAHKPLAARKPVESSSVIDATTPNSPTRQSVCRQTCNIVNGKPETSMVCRPYIADVEPSPIVRRAQPAILSHADKFAGTASRRRDESIAGTATGISPSIAERASVATARPNVITLTPTAPKCAIAEPMQIIAPSSPRCWIDDTHYCRYRPKGKTGYPCSCGNHSGYFG